MSFKNQKSHDLLREINKQTAVTFEDLTCEIDPCDTAVAEYDGVILQLIFPDPENGSSTFNLLLTDITKAETTVYFKNSSASQELSIGEVIELVNTYIKEAESALLKRKNQR